MNLAIWTVLALEKVALYCFWVPREINLRFCSKPQWATKLYKFGWYTSANSARMKNCRDLILCEVVYVAIIYRIPDSWIYLVNGYDFYFDHMTGENRELMSTCTLLNAWKVKFLQTWAKNHVRYKAVRFQISSSISRKWVGRKVKKRQSEQHPDIQMSITSIHCRPSFVSHYGGF